MKIAFFCVKKPRHIQELDKGNAFGPPALSKSFIENRRYLFHISPIGCKWSR